MRVGAAVTSCVEGIALISAQSRVDEKGDRRLRTLL